MKERKAPPVSRVEATTQVVSAPDFVDCFVSYDLLENGRRRLPVDSPQNEEAPLIHDASNRSRSRLTAASTSSDLMWRIRSPHSATMSAVAPGARFKRLKNSRRGLYAAYCMRQTAPLILCF